VRWSRTRRRGLIVALVVVALGGAGTSAWALTRTASAATGTSSLVAASTSDLSQTVAATGTIEPKEQSDLSFASSGTVTSVPATVGQKVSKGAVLATIDSTTLRSAVDTASAAVTAAEEQVSSVSGSSATQVAAANAQLAQARNDLAIAQDDLAAATITAPFSGTVATVGVAVGDTVGSTSAGGSTGASGAGGGGAATSSSSTSSTSAVTLISTDAWVVDASVGSSDLAELKKGQQAEITPTGSATKVFGTVSSLGIVATTSSSGTATFPVVIDVTGDPSGLYAGGSADVSVIIKKVTGVLTVPTQAIHTVNGKTVVYQKVSGKQVDTPVTIGTAYGALTEIKSGLKAGEQVVVTFAGPGGARTGIRPGGTRGAGGAGGAGAAGGGFPAGGFAGGNG
jgi:multidrug efflux pump subunit AcrA (membrane-fusion protein)